MPRWRILACCRDSDVEPGLARAAGELREPVDLTVSAGPEGWAEGEAEPHAALVCAGIPPAEALRIVRELRRRSPALVVVCVTSVTSDSRALEALRAGADDVIDASTPPAELLRRTVALATLRQSGAAEVRRAEARLRELEARYRALVELSKHGVAMLQGGRIAYINPAGAAMGGFTPEEVTGKPIAELLAPSHRARAEAIYGRLFDQAGASASGEAFLVTTAGRRVPVSFDAVTTESDGERSVLVMFGDVSERLARKEVAQRRSRELEMLQGLALDLGGSLEVERVVEAGCQRIARAARLDACAIYLFDRETRELVLAGPPVVGAGLPRFEATLPALEPSATERTGGGEALLVPLRARDALVGVLKAGRRPGAGLSSEEAQLVSAAATSVGLALDNARLYATLRESYQRIVHTQAELVRAERLAALGELSATVAHEVRNPLAAIYNSLAQLRRLVPEGGDAGTLLAIAQEEATRLNRIIADLLQFARPGEPDLRPTPLEEVIALAVRAARHDATARDEVVVVVEPVDPELHALCDGSRLRQALVNLVLNAFQAIPGPGSIRVRARPTEPGEEVVVEVEDDGPGIPPEVLERAFDPFFTTRPAGSGLGLAIVKRIVEDQRGSVSVDTAPGRGARFRLSFPRVVLPGP